jgi:TP901 family phage tail tape measure protein
MSQRTISVRLQAEVDQYRRDMQSAGQTTQETGQQFGNTSRASDMLGQAVRRAAPIVGAAGLGRYLRSSVEGAIELESSLTQMQSLVGLTADEVANLSDGFQDLSRSTGVSSQELADASFFISSAGLRGEAALDALEVSARATAVGLGETRTVADLLTSAMNAYGAENLSAARAGDILTGAVREGKLEAGQMAGALGQLLPTASAMDISFEQVAGTLAVLSRTGTDAASGATTLQSMMMALMSTSPQATEALAAVGLSMADLRDIAGGSDDGLIQVMRLLDQAFDGNDEALRQVIPNVQAFRGAMGLLAQEGEVVDEVMDGVANSTGLLDEAMEIWSGTTEAQLARTSAAWHGLKDELGMTLLPAIGVVLEQFNDATDRTLGGLNEQISAFARGDLVSTFLGNDWFNLADQIEDAAGKASTSAQGFNDAKNAVEDAGDAASDSAHEFAELTESLESLSEATGDYIDQARAQVDPVYAVQSAMHDLAVAQGWVNELQEEGKVGTEEYEAALWDEIAAAQDADFALRELSVALEESGVSTLTARDRMDYLKREFGLSEDAARLLISELDKYQERAESLPDIVINARGNAWERIAELRRMVGGWGDRSSTDMGSSRPRHESSRGRARGGPVSPGEPYLVGEEGPELVTFAKSGFVHDATTTAAALSAVPPSSAMSSRSVSVEQNFQVVPSEVELFRAREDARALAEVMA